MENLPLSEVGEIYYDVLRHAGAHIFVIDGANTFRNRIQKFLYTLGVLLIIEGFGLLHLIFYDTVDDFEEKTRHLGIFCNISCIVVRFLRVTSNVTLFKSFFIDFENFNCNQHRTNHAREKLSKSCMFIKKIDRNCIYFMAFVYICWYLAPALFGPLMTLVLNSDEMTYDKFIAGLPSTYSFPISSPLIELRYIYENLNCITLLALWQALDLSFFVFVFMLSTQFEILYDSIQTRKDVIGNDKIEPMGLKKLVQDHVALVKISRGLKEMLSPLLALQLVDSLILIGCLGSSTMASHKTDDSTLITSMVDFIKFATFLSMALFELFLFCWLSEVTNESNQNLGIAINDSHWYLDLKKKGDYVLPILISQRDMSFTALNMVGINLFRFLDVVRLSYSYFTIMDQFSQEK